MNSEPIQKSKHRTHQNLINVSSQPISILKLDDIDRVVSLSRTYFPRSNDCSFETLKKRTTDLYFKNEVLLPNVSPLVSRAANGTVDGFLGVITKPFRYGNRSITVANCHHLMATDEARKQLKPIRLLQKFLLGPQDISFSDGSTNSTRLIWQRLGGESVSGESMYYKVPLRPISFTANYLLKHRNRLLKNTILILSSLTDSVLGGLRLPFFHRIKPDINIRPLDTELMIQLLGRIESSYPLFPDYQFSDLDALLKLLDGESRYGKLYKEAIFDQNEEPIGWFIYYLQKSGLCEVIQAVSFPGKEDDLFNALNWHAHSKGGAELSGRLMPGQLQTSFTTRTISMPARMWTLIHSNDTELKRVIQSGKAFITRLEGDLWVL